MDSAAVNKQDYYLKKRKGIYRIAHKLNGMCYIGQSVDIAARWRQHLTPNKSCLGVAVAAEPHLFTFEILEECERELLNDREMFWIAHYDCIAPSGYNKTKGGGVPVPVKLVRPPRELKEKKQKKKPASWTW